MKDTVLSLDAVRAFVNIVDLGSFTRAAENLDTTQSAMSLKLKRLEEALGCGLVARTPRSVQLTAQGAAFLDRARELLEAHDRAIAVVSQQRRRMTIGISDHVAGPELPTLISRMNTQDPALLIEIRIGTSGELLQSFDRRELDTVIVRFHVGRSDGKTIAEEKFGWYAADGWHRRPGEPLPLVTMPEPCGVRSMACRLLDEAGIAWTDAFVGGGVTTVAAAVMARVGIAAIAKRMLPAGAVDLGPRLKLPDLPRLPIVVHTREKDDRARRALDILSHVFRDTTKR
ncbi:LysR family transcriptional regulator [Notoacmeibacter sp. MSK16QG-6]|uniref:LysR family transcriptional regulator n=1 Tax=Notoacmeibacter sp. MSK16QG-6 TaxID=2957982 RepID=UPI0020A126C7|nr:LysR family transcriptional regulator [Notoacmeibacter sp. MSK16QG-6]MCP1200542.1 LysR family transcriptional regulator [Notoacmeibacter sp. MSK16QG-6]